MNDTTRDELIERIRERAKDAMVMEEVAYALFSVPQKDDSDTDPCGDYFRRMADKAVEVFLNPIIYRWQPEPDAVHAVHEALVNSAPEWMIDREDGELFDMARAALAAVPTEEPDLTLVYMKGYQDGQDAVAKAKKGQSDEDSR